MILVLGNRRHFQIRDISFVPARKYSLIFTGALVRIGGKVTHISEGVQIEKKNGSRIDRGERIATMITLQNMPVSHCHHETLLVDSNTWHACFQNIYPEQRRRMSSYDAVKGLGVLNEDRIKARGSCAAGKMTLTNIARTSGVQQKLLLSKGCSDV